MSEADRFAAGVLEASAGGLGGMAASLLLEEHPAVGERWGRGAFDSWRTALTQRVLELGAAVRIADPEVFVGRVRWSRRAFVAREVPVEDLRAGLVCLATVLRERLPEPVRATALGCLEQGLAGLDAVEAEPESGPAADTVEGKLALAYLAAILEGRPRRAEELLVEAVEGGLDVRRAYLEVLVPAQREIGRLWHLGSASIAEEHLVTATTERVMTLLTDRASRAERLGKRALVAGVEGNAHEVGLRVLAELLELDGWDVLYLGADVPTADLVAAAAGFGVDVVLLAGSLATHVRELTAALERLKALDTAPAVLVGGAAFDGAPGLWERLGADGYSPDLGEAVAAVRDLVA